jgi:photosystem II stability/assembly factor-like uncharacterized protein
MRPSTIVGSCLAVVALLLAPMTAGASPSSRAAKGTAVDRSVELVPTHAALSGADLRSGGPVGLGSNDLKRWALLDRSVAAAGVAGPNYELECTAKGRGRNLNLDCDHPFLPKNEPHIEVDPEDPDHMIASANDYESCCDQFYTTFDGGKTWAVGDMSTIEEGRIGSDPVTVFDPVTDTAIHSSLNFIITDEGLAAEGDLVVSLSHDGGITWEKAIEVADGEGDDDDPVQIFNDKEWIVTDVDPDSPFYGRTYLTWTRFLSNSGVYVESPIWESHSDDGGLTWSPPQEISGSNARFCTFQAAGPGGECDQGQFSVPTVAPDGTVYVAFTNEQHEAAWEPGEVSDDQYLVVKSADGGQTWSDPTHVTDMEDGSRDYPLNVNDRQTLTGYQVRVNPAGSIVAHPRSGKLFLVFSDNRNGRHDVDRPVTDTDVFMATSLDGVHWSRPRAISTAASDQWFPWADVNPATGKVGVIFHDRSSRNPDLYHTTLAERSGGSWRMTRLNTEPSDPTRSLFFQAEASGCFKCATFFGDYIGLAYGSDGSANTVWTDMRRSINLGDGNRGKTEDIFFRRV